MASKKKLQKAAVKFRKENPALYAKYSWLLSSMTEAIKKGI